MNIRTMACGLLLITVWTTTSFGSERIYDATELAAGQGLYRNNCAECHGANGEGKTADWRQRDEQGNLPPPPLNGTAHTWHHAAKVLFRTIKDGTAELGGAMPAWSGKLTDDEVILIINWITSLWPDEIYEAWQRRN